MDYEKDIGKYQLRHRTSLIKHLPVYIAVAIIIGVTVISTEELNRGGGANVNGVYNNMDFSSTSIMGLTIFKNISGW